MSAAVTFVLEQSSDGGYEAHALGHSIYTGGDTLEAAIEMARDAVVCHFEDGDQPKDIRFIHIPEDCR